MIIQAMTGMIASETKTVDDVPSWVWSSPLIDTVVRHRHGRVGLLPPSSPANALASARR